MMNRVGKDEPGKYKEIITDSYAYLVTDQYPGAGKKEPGETSSVFSFFIILLLLKPANFPAVCFFFGVITAMYYLNSNNIISKIANNR